jgi:hypothetical protein
MKQQVLQTSCPRANETIATKHFHNKSGCFVTVLFEGPRYLLDDVALTIFRSAEQPRVDYVFDVRRHNRPHTICGRSIGIRVSHRNVCAAHCKQSERFPYQASTGHGDVVAMEEVATVSHNGLNGHTSPFATLHRSQG